MSGRSILIFPFCAILASALALLFPQMFMPLRSAIVPLLMLVMFGMGLTLTWQQVRDALQMPRAVLAGLFLQIGIMPFAAWALSGLLGLDTALLIGMVLVGSAPGGTASNIMCYLAGANTALSIVLTAASTLLAVLSMPLLSLFYAGHAVDVPFAEMLLGIARIVLLPVAAGIYLNHRFGVRLAAVKHLMPWVSIFAVVLIIAIVVALNQEELLSPDWRLVLAVALHNATGLLIGYGGAHLMGFDKQDTRTLAIEVGMQNSGLSVALALKFFGAAAALPGAIFSIWHNISGAMLASWWRRTSSFPA